MREAINNNPMVQIAVIGVLVVLVGLFMVTNLKKGSSSSGSSTESSATSSPLPTGSSAGAAAPTGVAGSTGAAPSAAGVVPPATSGSVSPDALVPGPGLPQPVVKAWKADKAIVILIARPHGIDDRLVSISSQSLANDPRIALFRVPANEIARYSRITQGVGVDRVPALVVVRPQRESGSVPQAQVSYGFRNSEGVVQAVHDALYTGPDDLPYSPR